MKKKVASVATVAVLTTAFAGNVFADSYIVKKGDTLSHIAIKYHTTISELKQVNHLKSDLIYVNQTLAISKYKNPAPVKTVSPAPVKTVSPAPVQTAKPTPAPSTVKTYKVVSGDNLGGIAAKNGISLAELMSWNGLKSHLIYPGDVLKVSKPSSSAAPSTGTAAGSKAPANSAPAVTAPTSSEYTIKSGDTLSKIALQFETTIKELKSLNKLRSDLIYVGDTIKVPAEDTDTSTSVTVPEAPEVPVTPPVSETTDPANVDKLLSTAKALVGIPYAWGGTTLTGFDCSGFIYYVFNQAGKSMARLTAGDYYNRSFYVDAPVPGDLLFFENTYKVGISHLGIYLGDDQFIHADSSGVRITNVNDAYYSKHFDGYKRLY